MKIGVLFGTLWCLHAASAEVHSYKAFYTASSGIDNFPEFVIVGMVDDVQYLRYDSNSQQAVLTQEWMNSITADDPQYLLGQTQIAQGQQQTFKANINIVKERFNQTAGVHTYQWMLGCQWDDVTEAVDGFDLNGYDGEDFFSLDIKNFRYIASKQQSEQLVNRWNSNPGYLAYWKQYYSNDCIEWLKKHVQYGSSTLGRKVEPEVSLLQKGPELVCHATGFHPDSVMITWKKNGVEMDDDVDVGETLPNEDGTFQKRAVLTVSPEEREKAQYSCEVTHKGSIFRPREPHRGEVDTGTGTGTGTIIGIIAAVLVVGGVIAVIVVMVLKRKGEKEYDKASSQDTNSDISNSNPIVRNETEKLNPDPSV